MSIALLSRQLDRLMGCLGIGRLGQNALLSTLGLGTRALIQAFYLVVLSRWMGPTGYGLFAASVAAAIIISLLSGWGISFVLTQQIARNPESSSALWATAIFQVVVSGTILLGLYLLLSELTFVERLDTWSMLLLGIAELIVLPLTYVATSLCLALGNGVAAAISMCLVPAFRLIFMMIALGFGWVGTPDNVAYMHFIGSIVGMITAICLIGRIDGAPAWQERMPWKAATTKGSRYAIGSLVGSSYQEVDKVLMLQLLGATVVGTYTVAFRVMSIFTLPVVALMGAVLPRLFDTHGTPEGSRLLKVVALSAIGYGVLASLAAAAFSPLLPSVFGSSYEGSAKYLLMLSPWALAFAMHQSAAIGLTAANRHGVRVLVESLGFATIIGMNVWLLRAFGAGASVVTLLATELLMAVGCWLVTRRK